MIVPKFRLPGPGNQNKPKPCDANYKQNNTLVQAGQPMFANSNKNNNQKPQRIAALYEKAKQYCLPVTFMSSVHYITIYIKLRFNLQFIKSL